MAEDYKKLTKDLERLRKKKTPKKSQGSKRILKKPSAKGIQKLSAVNAVKGLASVQAPLVKEIEKKEIVRDDRSLYFNNELSKEKKKWLI